MMESLLQGTQTTCPICLKFLDFKTSVEHKTCKAIFCTECIYTNLTKCPICTDIVSLSDFSSVNPLVKQLASSKPVTCFSCSSTFLLKDIQEHEEICPLVSFQCQFQGCNKMIERQNIEEHKNECCHNMDKIVTCNSCNSYTCARKDINEHHKTCLRYTVTCRFNECPEMIERRNVSLHEARCTHRTSLCQYCKNEFSKANMLNHLDECEERSISCNNCSKTLQFKELSYHIHFNCSYVTCPVKTCNCATEDLNEHLKSEHGDWLIEQINNKQKMLSNLMNVLFRSQDIGNYAEYFDHVKELKTFFENQITFNSPNAQNAFGMSEFDFDRIKVKTENFNGDIREYRKLKRPHHLSLLEIDERTPINISQNTNTSQTIIKRARKYKKISEYLENK
jgi:hypothetical protein